MNLPKTSSPTTAANATRSPSLAAPHAKMAPDPPMTIFASSTSRSACPNAGTTVFADQHEVRVGVTEHQDIEARHAEQRTGRAGSLSFDA